MSSLIFILIAFFVPLCPKIFLDVSIFYGHTHRDLKLNGILHMVLDYKYPKSCGGVELPNNIT